MPDVRELLRRHGIRPSKGLGQNFLTSDAALGAIVAAAELTPEDVVLEVGPGLGLLTRRLAERAGVVVAVELDERMVAALREEVGDRPNVHVVAGDILEVDPAAAVSRALGREGAGDLRYKVVANLPYYITSAALRQLLEASVRPTLLVLMVQREVAQRITAVAGGAVGRGDMSLLAVSVQVYGEPEVVRRVPARAFYPRPKVDSAVVRIRVHPEPRVPDELRRAFFRVARAAFAQRRKQLVNSLSANLALGRGVVEGALRAAGVEPSRRPQTVSIEEWVEIARSLPQG